MRLGTVRAGGTGDAQGSRRDGTLVLIASDGARLARVAAISPTFEGWPTLQSALDDWDNAAPALREAARKLDDGTIAGESIAAFEFAAPLPRAYEWLDGSAFLSHVRLARRSRNAEPPADLLENPLMYQGGSGHLLGPRDPLIIIDPTYGLDFEAELAVITGDVPLGIDAPTAAASVRLVCLVNDVTLRNLVAPELAKGFGFVHAKPPTAFAPFAVTPDELGAAYRDGRVHLRVHAARNGVEVGHPHAAEMHFSFFELVAHAARTRPLTAGTIIGSGTISNEDPATGVACLVEARMRETLATGKPQTAYLQPGEKVSIWVDDDGRANPRPDGVFGRIEQEVKLR